MARATSIAPDLAHQGLVTFLTSPVARSRVGQLTPIAENLIVLRNVDATGSLRRVMPVMKIRDGAFDPRLRRFEIETGEYCAGGRRGRDFRRPTAKRWPSATAHLRDGGRTP
jgi:KaiC/GvpD/RAD55 family RecA-like ATPase